MVLFIPSRVGNEKEKQTHVCLCWLRTIWMSSSSSFPSHLRPRHRSDILHAPSNHKTNYILKKNPLKVELSIN